MSMNDDHLGVDRADSRRGPSQAADKPSWRRSPVEDGRLQLFQDLYWSIQLP